MLLASPELCRHALCVLSFWNNLLTGLLPEPRSACLTPCTPRGLALPHSEHSLLLGLLPLSSPPTRPRSWPRHRGPPRARLSPRHICVPGPPARCSVPGPLAAPCYSQARSLVPRDFTYKTQMQRRNYEEFQDGNSRALNHMLRDRSSPERPHSMWFHVYKAPSHTQEAILAFPGPSPTGCHLSSAAPTGPFRGRQASFTPWSPPPTRCHPGQSPHLLRRPLPGTCQAVLPRGCAYRLCGFRDSSSMDPGNPSELLIDALSRSQSTCCLSVRQRTAIPGVNGTTRSSYPWPLTPPRGWQCLEGRGAHSIRRDQQSGNAGMGFGVSPAGITQPSSDSVAPSPASFGHLTHSVSVPHPDGHCPAALTVEGTDTAAWCHPVRSGGAGLNTALEFPAPRCLCLSVAGGLTVASRS